MNGTSVTQAELWAVLLDRLKQDEEVDETVALAMIETLMSIPIYRPWASVGSGASGANNWARRSLISGQSPDRIFGVEPVRALVFRPTMDREWHFSVSAREGLAWKVTELRGRANTIEDAKTIADDHLKACGALLLGRAA